MSDTTKEDKIRDLIDRVIHDRRLAEALKRAQGARTAPPAPGRPPATKGPDAANDDWWENLPI